jgi:hypothetical protein
VPAAHFTVVLSPHPLTISLSSVLTGNVTVPGVRMVGASESLMWTRLCDWPPCRVQIDAPDDNLGPTYIVRDGGGGGAVHLWAFPIVSRENREGNRRWSRATEVSLRAFNSLTPSGLA